MELSKILSLPDYIITEEICEYDCFKVCQAQKIQSQIPVIIKTLKTGANQIDIAKIINEYEIILNLDIENYQAGMTRIGWINRRPDTEKMKLAKE